MGGTCLGPGHRKPLGSADLGSVLPISDNTGDFLLALRRVYLRRVLVRPHPRVILRTRGEGSTGVVQWPLRPPNRFGQCCSRRRGCPHWWPSMRPHGAGRCAIVGCRRKLLLLWAGLFVCRPSGGEAYRG